MTPALPYNDYGGAMRRRFGCRVQKLAIDAHLGCPHRDAKSGIGGCTFCLGEAFSPNYCRTSATIYEQIEHAIAFHAARRRTAERYIAYFQAGSNTNAPIEQLEQLYDEALRHPAISGLIIATRPDCIDSEKLDLLDYFSHRTYTAVEYGVESVYDTTLMRVNRGHNFAQSVEAILSTKQRDIEVGAHFILGLPGETIEQMVDGVDCINTLDIDFIKFHQLQIYRSSPIASLWHSQPELFALNRGIATEEYIDLICRIIRHLRSDIAIERIASTAPRHLIEHSPLGGIRPDALREMVISHMHTIGATQGDMANNTK